jgi:hypothetical protein
MPFSWNINLPNIKPWIHLVIFIYSLTFLIKTIFWI